MNGRARPAVACAPVDETMDPTLTATLVGGAFAIGGAVLGAIASIAAASLGFRKARAAKTIQDLADEVVGYHRLEKLYIAELADVTGKSRLTIMRSARGRVGQPRPSMTETEAVSIKRRWS